MDTILITNPSGHMQEFLEQRAEHGENVVEHAFGQALENILGQWQSGNMALKAILKLPADEFTWKSQKLLDYFESQLQWVRKELQNGILS